MNNFRRIARVSLALAAAATLLCSCDFFRRLAGRPTSADIEAKRQKIEAERIVHERQMDSLRIAQKMLADSLARVDSLKALKPVVPGETVEDQTTTYVLSVGVYAKEVAAKKHCRIALKRGFDAHMVRRGDWIGVVIAMSNNKEELETLKAQPKTKRLYPSSAILEKIEN